MSNQPIMEVKDLSVHFKLNRKNTVHAVTHVNLTINQGETVGLVGESGCGKTTLGRAIKHIYEPTSGEVIYNGESVQKMNKAELRRYKQDVQMIFQDPYSSLDPRMTIGEIISEGMDVHLKLTGEERQKRIVELLAAVGLTEQFAGRFAHELSGGQRQRVGIARALAVDPDFIVCDEPISALDVSIQAQIVNLLIKLQKERGLTYLFISHDLSMVKHISDRVGVMYLGSLVELASSETIFKNAKHPYTQALMAAIPEVDFEGDGKKTIERLQGEGPSPINPPPGCRFAARCKYATDICRQQQPQLVELEPDHFVACHHCK